MNIYVGNLAREATEDQLRKEFQSFGTVGRVTIIKDRFSGEPRGFGFVEMASSEQAEEAIATLNGKELLGRRLNVNEARPRGEGESAGAPRRAGSRSQSVPRREY